MQYKCSCFFPLYKVCAFPANIYLAAVSSFWPNVLNVLFACGDSPRTPLKKMLNFVRCCVRRTILNFVKHCLWQILNYLGILVNVISFFVDEIGSLCHSNVGIYFHIEREVRRRKWKLKTHAEKHSHARYDLLYLELCTWIGWMIMPGTNLL